MFTGTPQTNCWHSLASLPSSLPCPSCLARRDGSVLGDASALAKCLTQPVLRMAALSGEGRAGRGHRHPQTMSGKKFWTWGFLGGVSGRAEAGLAGPWVSCPTSPRYLAFVCSLWFHLKKNMLTDQTTKTTTTTESPPPTFTDKKTPAYIPQFFSFLLFP